MMKLKGIRRSRGPSHEKIKSAAPKGRQRQVRDEQPQRLWSLLLPHGYLPKDK